MSIDGKQRSEKVANEIVTDCSELLKLIAGDSRVTQDWGRLFDHNIVPTFVQDPSPKSVTQKTYVKLCHFATYHAAIPIRERLALLNSARRYTGKGPFIPKSAQQVTLTSMIQAQEEEEEELETTKATTSRVEEDPTPRSTCGFPRYDVETEDSLRRFQLFLQSTDGNRRSAKMALKSNSVQNNVSHVILRHRIDFRLR